MAKKHFHAIVKIQEGDNFQLYRNKICGHCGKEIIKGAIHWTTAEIVAIDDTEANLNWFHLCAKCSEKTLSPLKRLNSYRKKVVFLVKKIYRPAYR